jgi:hypothetical protein
MNYSFEGGEDGKRIGLIARLGRKMLFSGKILSPYAGCASDFGHKKTPHNDRAQRSIMRRHCLV